MKPSLRPGPAAPVALTRVLPRALARSATAVGLFASLGGCERAPIEPRPAPDAIQSPSSAPPRPPLKGASPDSGLDPGALAAKLGSPAAPATYFVLNSRIGVAGSGLARLDAEGVHELPVTLERRIHQVLLGPDRAVYLVDDRSLRRIEGDDLVEVERFSFEDVAPVSSLALTPAGATWLVGAPGVATRVGGEWEATALAELGLGHGTQVIVSPGPADVQVWLVDDRQARLRDASGTWTTIELSTLGRGAVLRHAHALPEPGSGASGNPPRLVATDGARLLVLGEAGVEALPLTPDPVEPSAPALPRYRAALDVNAHGQVLVASGACELLRLDLDLGRPGSGPGSEVSIRERWTVDAARYDCRGLQAVALDDRSRAWVVAREGLSVLTPQLEVREFPAGSFEALAGRVTHMLVVGPGPELPVAPPIQTASLSGELRIGSGQNAPAAASVRLELCPTPEPPVEPGASPCARAPHRLEAKTDADGRFRVDAVPLGDHGIAVLYEGRWRYTVMPSFAAKLRAGEVHDLGRVIIPSGT